MSDVSHAEGSQQFTKEEIEDYGKLNHARNLELSLKGKLMRGAAFGGLGIAVLSIGKTLLGLGGGHYLAEIAGAAAVAAGMFAKKAWDGIKHSEKRDEKALKKSEARLRTA